MATPFLSISSNRVSFSGELEVGHDAASRDALKSILSQLQLIPLPNNVVKAAKRLIPFSDESISIGDLTVESSSDEVLFYGTLDLDVSKANDLSSFATLSLLLSDAAQVLETASLNKSLAEKMGKKAPKIGGNPFA